MEWPVVEALFIITLTGGNPIMVTDSTPSYLHGWSPNGKKLSILLSVSAGILLIIFIKTCQRWPGSSAYFNTVVWPMALNILLMANGSITTLPKPVRCSCGE